MNLDNKISNIESLISEGLKFLLKKTNLIILVFISIITLLLVGLFASQKIIIPVPDIISFWLGSIFMMTGVYTSHYFTVIRRNYLTEELLDNKIRSFRNFFNRGLRIGAILIALPLAGLILVMVIFDIKRTIYYLLGISVVAFFSRVAGGLFAKSADMSSNMVVSEIEDIKPGDVRNCSNIADNIGDYLGNSIAVGADLVESFIIVLLSVVLLVISYLSDNIFTLDEGMSLLIYPLAIAVAGTGLGFLCGKFLKRVRQEAISTNLIFSIYLTAILVMIFAFIVIKLIPINNSSFLPFIGIPAKYAPFLAVVFGLFLAIIIGANSDYFTSDYHNPTKEVAGFTQYNSVLSILMGLSSGMLSIIVPIISSVVLTILINRIAGVYGIIMLGLGLLSVSSVIIGANSYAPFADNASGIAKLSKLSKGIISKLDSLNSYGNTIVALGKSYAVGAVLVVCFSLFILFVRLSGISYLEISLFHPLLIGSILVGGILPFLFASALLRSVVYTAVDMYEESVRQFNNVPFLKEGKSFPNLADFVDSIGAKILKGMVVPSLFVFLIPVVIGIFLGPEVLASVLFGAIITGIYLSIQYSMTGATLDNAKKFIEKGYLGGVGTKTYANAITGDIFGDSLKDLIGPSINNFLKLMLIISIVIIPIII